MIGGSTAPDDETPIAAMPIARPRCSTNHFESVTLTARLPSRAAPNMLNTPRSSTHCHSSRTSATANSAPASSVAPMSISGLAPKRSTYTPTKKPAKAMKNCPVVWPYRNSARVQPRSSLIGTRNAPAM